METMRNHDSNSRFPFTSSQWQELEHQALVYKYMISGMPIPPDLLFSIKRSLDPSTKLILHHQSPHQSIGWNCFQMGFGRKIDPEPGRCRRTDGKKWRCSKEAYPDSKYCERHMHRGRNRSRKPVEVNLSSTQPLSMCNKPPAFLYPQLSSSSCSRPVLSSHQDRMFMLESRAYYSHSEKDQSYGMKEDQADEHPFFSENSCGTMSASMADSWHLEPLAINNSSSSSSKQQTFSDYKNGYSYDLQLQNTPKQQQQNQDQLGLEIERKDEPQKMMHHFFDESPRDANDSSSTQLSISIPSCAHDFFLTHNDK
ncbi:growth-regulating factor 6-like isoform X2 [Cynara cardunculus var. scolymus]|uniref:Growth-regulating factor n=1 Tax=Cynara cardunculus var. scolymus TaxID=59895 RepID=A0A103YN99_CYNCS|nr:growth-regulating factor 6-like isoform X2 [Cynara cardunculus var. scolymus]KVI12203.1 Glutamine-Leucine-Glutamine, QLQ [Cynara cardunculus var. scolymus]